MTLYDDIFNLRYTSSVLKNRTTVAVAKAAQDILAEDPSTVNHANRIIWARQALSGTASQADTFMWAILSNAAVRAVGEDATDAQIQSAVDAAVDNFAIGA